ncbi:GntR family transcriptional regulator [Salipiger mangrovisoli]|uniref:GntR family transcriptional regulator n=1 Tax=Salipiger mangrovisoli TaxID=2865933 RepID=UPI001F121DC4|nr:GntR family transcriptional regulator [Salipiger mangrovisoli]
MTDLLPDVPALPPASESPTAIAQWVADVLRDRIVKGVYPPGSRLVERRISAELDLSRTPVREALKLLHQDGLIEISRNKGAQVVRCSAEEARQLFEVIASLESLAAERLARTLTPELLDEIEEMHARMMTYYKIGNQTDYFDTNSEIHDFVVAACGNPVIHDAHKRLIARARYGRFVAIHNPDRLAQSVAEHEALMEALRSGDEVAAARVWRQHLQHTGESFAAMLEAETA